MDEVVSLLESTGIPFAYHHFAEGASPKPPFICYLVSANNNFSADGVAYLKVNRIRIELYTDKKDLEQERLVEDALDEAGIFYTRFEAWIKEERLFEVSYEFDMEVKTHG